jgi:hypothetical protein
MAGRSVDPYLLARLGSRGSKWEPDSGRLASLIVQLGRLAGLTVLAVS